MERDPQAFSAWEMRRGVGWIAILLPWVIGLGYWVFGRHLGGGLGSISESYYTVMRDVFVGALAAVAFFLLAYRGYSEFEDRFFNGLAVLAALILLFSMNPEAVPTHPIGDPPSCHQAVEMAPTCSIALNQRLLMFHYEAFGWIHFGAATLLFACLGYVSLFFFRRTDGVARGPKKGYRDKVYLVCGLLIWGALAVYVLFLVAKTLTSEAGWVQALDHGPLLFVVETVCLEAFGFSWLVKGDGVYGLSDPPEQGASGSPK